MVSSDLLVTFVSKRDSLNRLADALAKTKVYMEVGTPTPRLRDPELDFIRVVSWLYIHHVEAGATSIKFLTGLFDGFAVDGDRRGRSHVTDIGRIRAELQHNLVSDSFSDQITKRHCERWYLAACGTRMPGARKHWTLCVRRILSDAIALLEALEECLRALEADAGLEEKIIIWRRRLTRSYSPADFDRVVETVARDLGREGLDATRFRRRYYDRWKSELDLLEDGADFEKEIRRLVETSLVHESLSRPPITGVEIMEELAIEPGRTVGWLLEFANQLYQAGVRDRRELMERIRAEIRGSTDFGR
jgi:hypothetical protein